MTLLADCTIELNPLSFWNRLHYIHRVYLKLEYCFKLIKPNDCIIELDESLELCSNQITVLLRLTGLEEGSPVFPVLYRLDLGILRYL